MTGPQAPAADPSAPQASAEPTPDRDEQRRPASDGAVAVHDKEEDGEQDLGEQLRWRAEAERGLHSLRGTPVGFDSARQVGRNSGTAGMGDGSITVGGGVGVINISGKDRAGRRARAIPPGDVDLLRQVFVPPPGNDGGTTMPGLIAALTNRRIETVIGQPGSGREALAIIALATALPTGSRVARFEKGIDAGSIVPEDLVSGHGYLLDGTVSARQGHLDAVVADMREFAESRGAHVVVIVDEDAASLSSVAGGGIRHRPPDRMQVLRQHLKARTDAVPVDRLPESVSAEIASVPMGQIRDIAPLVARALSENKNAGTYLPSHVRDQVRSMLKAPFPGDQAIGVRAFEAARIFRRAFLVSLAVFNDMPLDVVNDAAIRLATALTPGIPVSRRVGLPFTDDTSSLLAWATASLDGVADQEQSAAPADVLAPPVQGTSRRVHLNSPLMPGMILETLWHEHHLARDPVLKWLDEIARASREGSRSDGVPLRAAQVIGRLAAYDFDRIVNEHIEDWVKTQTTWGQRVAAWAVEVMIDNDELAERTWEQVHRWSTLSRSWWLACLRVYSTHRGAQHVAEALDLVRREAVRPARGRSGVIPAVVHAVAASGGGDEVWVLFRGWLRDIDSAQRLARRHRAAARLVSPLPAHAARSLLLLAADKSNTRALLIDWARRDAASWRAFTRLWRIALTVTGSAPRAWRLLHEWLVETDADPVWEQTVEALVRELAADALVKRHLAFYADGWRIAWDDHHETARRVIQKATH